MFKLNVLKVVFATIFFSILLSFTYLNLADPPTVSDITVCDGGSTLIVPVAPPGPSGIAAVLATQDFDGGGHAYTLSVDFNDGVNDHYGITDGSDISNISGNYSFDDGVNLFVAAEDVDDNGGNGNTVQTMILDPVVITGYENIKFCFDLAAGNNNPVGSNGYDATDFVDVEYTLDGTAGAGKLCFRYFDNGDNFNEPLHHDPNCDGDGSEGVQILVAAAQYCYSLTNAEIAGVTNVDFTISVGMNSAAEEVAFDNVVITGDLAVPPTIVYNFYDVDPIPGTTIPVAIGQPSYDPLTTVASSPDTIWVTSDDGVMESTAVQVIVIVESIPVAEAGMGGLLCGIDSFQIVAVEPLMDQEGFWTGGSGIYGNDTLASTTYTPDASEIGTNVTLTWNVETVNCGSDTDEINIFVVAESADAEYSYLVDTICLGDGSLFPFHTTGVDGYYEVIAGDADSVALDPFTGEINLENSGMGTFDIQNTVTACGNIMISGIIDATLPGGIPKAVELFVASDVANIASYSIGSANNGGGTDGEEFIFPDGNYAAGSYIYIASDSVAFEAFFGFKPDYVTNALLINGDDAMELFCDGNVIDLFGDIDTDGTGQPWEYMDGWAYRNNNLSPNANTFNDANWFYSGTNALDGEMTNAGAATPFPLGTYSTTYTGTCPASTFVTTISLGDFEAPVIYCPSDMTITLDPGDCGAFAQIMDPSAMDNCTDSLVFVQVSGPLNGDYMDRANSPYTVVYEAIEDNGGIIVCSYDIIIEEYPVQTSTLACNGAINISLDENCEVFISADMLLEGGTYGCYEDFGITATFEGQPVGTTVDNPYGAGYSVIMDNSIMYQQIEVSVIEIETGNSCWGYVTIEDKFAPIIDSCNNITLACGDDFSPVEPTVTENCGGYIFDMDEDVIDGECQDTFAQQIIRTWIVIDGSGNVSDECVQVITILKDSFSNIQLPLHHTGHPGDLNALNCDGAGTEWAVGPDGLPSSTAIGVLPGTGEPSLGAGCNSLHIYYSDDVLPICENSYKVLRNWTIIEWCTGELLEYTQIIKVGDFEGPEFTAPSDVTMGVDPWCEGEYFLPTIVGTDNCSSNVSISFSSLDGLNDGQYMNYANVDLGTPHIITVTAIDDCGIETKKDFTVTFVDNIPPVVNGETSLTVTLSIDGTAKIHAESFDDGSYDACGDIGFSVIRMVNSCAPQDYYPPAGDDNYQFNEIVHFCCSDVGTPQMVVFQVCDDADGDEVFGSGGDNCNTSMVEVIVQDKTAPTIACPEFMTISCLDAVGLDLTNLDLMDNLFGIATATNVCSGSMTQNAIASEDCGDGFIIRTFIAVNEAGAASCSQIITVQPNPENLLTCNRIAFKSLNNNLYSWCAVNDNNNDIDDDLPAVQIDCNDGFDIPELEIDTDGLCTEVGINIEVDTFNFAGGACKKYLIHYEVIDQCVFDENYVDPETGEIDIYNSSNGYFEFYIEVDAFDNDGPDFAPANETIAAQDCENGAVDLSFTATDGCTDAAYIAFHYRIDLFGDNTIDYPSSGWANGNTIVSGANGLGVLPVGEHIVLWYLTDGCGNNSTASSLIIIEDNQKQPTPYCLTGLKASLSAMGMLMIEASDLDAGSFDNCTDQEDLIFSFSSDVTDTERMYTCDDLGFQFIQIYVTDHNGNQDFCNTTFLVQDNGEFCSNMISFSGEISSENEYMNKDAKVNLMQNTQMMQTTNTDVDGQYAMSIGSINDDYELTVKDNNDLVLGVTTLDIIKIQKHILGIDPFTTNAQRIAGDVDNSHSISGVDIIQIRKVLLGYQDYFKNNDSWVLYPMDHDLEAQLDPYNYPTSINVSTSDSYDWRSIKVADVNASHDFLLGAKAETRSNFLLEYDFQLHEDGTEISFYGNGADLAGLHLQLEGISKEDFVRVSSANIDMTSENVRVEGDLKMVWYNLGITEQVGDKLFSIIVKTGISDINLTLLGKVNEAYIGKSVHTDVQSVSIVKREDQIEFSGNEISIYPNPFTESIYINLEQLKEQVTEIKVYDAQGRVVFEVDAKDTDIVEIKDAVLTGAGIYYIQLSSESITISRKIIKLK